MLLELDARGLAAEPLLARHGLSRVQLLDPDGWIPLRLHVALLRDAIQTSGDPAFAAVAGRHFRLEAAGVVGHAAAASATVREALELWARFGRLLADGFQADLVRVDGQDVAAFAMQAGGIVNAEGLLAMPAALTSFLARLTGGTVRPQEIRLPGKVSPAQERLERVLGAPVRYGASRVEIRFPAGVFDLPLSSAEPRVKAVLVETAERDLRLREGTSAADRVHAAVVALGFARSKVIGAVAERLGTSARSLQRHLTAEGLSYSAVREAALREAAERLLAEGALPVTAVAFELGFASRSAFYRALRRWTGKRPGELRPRT